MTNSTFTLRPQAEGDQIHIDNLLDQAFGPGRYTRTAYRLREGVGDISQLAYVAQSGGKIVGSLKYWPVFIGNQHRALLLGPLAVHPDWRGGGCGLALMECTLPLAKTLGFGLVILVGDLSYYERVGFSQAPAGRVQFPGPVNLSRLLWLELSPGASAGVAGGIGKYTGALSSLPEPGPAEQAEQQ